MKLTRHRARRVIVAEAKPFFSTTYPTTPRNFCYDIGMQTAVDANRRTVHRMELPLDEALKLHADLTERLKNLSVANCRACRCVVEENELGEDLQHDLTCTGFLR